MSKHIITENSIMENLTMYELKQIARSRHVKNYQDMSREKLLRTLDESMGLKRILKIQNLSKK